MPPRARPPHPLARFFSLSWLYETVLFAERLLPSRPAKLAPKSPPRRPTSLGLLRLEARETPDDLLGLLTGGCALGGLVLIDGRFATPLEVFLGGWGGGDAPRPASEQAPLAAGWGDTLPSLVNRIGESPATAVALADERSAISAAAPLSEVALAGGEARDDDWLDTVGAYLNGTQAPSEDTPESGGGGDAGAGGAGFQPSIAAPALGGWASPSTSSSGALTHEMAKQPPAIPGTQGGTVAIAPEGQSLPAPTPIQRDPVLGGSLEGQAAETTQEEGQSPSPSLDRAFGRTRLAFEANEGQTDPQVRFLTRGAGFTAWLTQDRVVFSVPRLPGEAGQVALRDVFAMRFVGADTGARVEGTDPLLYRSNYFVGDDPSKWQTDVRNFGSVVYHDIYPGIDLTFRSMDGTGRQFEYDFTVRPGADLATVRLRWEGLEGVTQDAEGRLLLNAGGRTVVQDAPVLFQTDAGVKSDVAGQVVQFEGGDVGFEAPQGYDATKTLVVDPVIGFSTYLGGSGGDRAKAIAVGAAGDSYITGTTASPNFPKTTGLGAASQPNIFLSRLNPAGSALRYSTVLGSIHAGTEVNAVAVDGGGNAYVAGWAPYGYPTSPGAYSTGGQNGGAIVTRLSPTGNTFISTYLGTTMTHATRARGIAVDGSGRAYVTGIFGGWGPYPTTPGVFQPNPGQGFLTVLNPSFSAMYWSMYLNHVGNALTIDASKNVYVTGTTSSSQAFVWKLSSDGRTLLYSSVLGGTGTDEGLGIAVDAGGYAYVAGKTMSNFGFSLVGGPQTTYGGGGSDGFLVRLGPLGGQQFGTFFGGSGDDAIHAVAVDPRTGQTFVTGSTTSSDFVTTADAVQLELNGPSDAFIVNIGPAGFLRYSTLVGGSSDDVGTGVAVNATGVYAAGWTSSQNFLTLPGAYQPSNRGGEDAWALKLWGGLPPPVIQSFTHNSGDSTDRITNRTNLVFSGTASPNRTVKLEVNGRFAGVAPSNAQGQWTIACAAGSVGEGKQNFVATLVSGAFEISPSSAPYKVTVDLMAPFVGLSLGGSGQLTETSSSRPLMSVSIGDDYGLAPNAAFVIDVDRNNDGDFLDPDESNQASGAIGLSQIRVPAPGLPALQYPRTVTMRVRSVMDLAGNASGPAQITFDVVPAASGIDATLTVDNLNGNGLAQSGVIHVEHALDIDLSPGAGVGGDPALAYNSDRVKPRPIVAASVTFAEDFNPTVVTTRLTWNGVQQAARPHPFTGDLAGDTLIFADQLASPVAATGSYPFTLTVHAATASSSFDVSLSGALFVVAEDVTPFGSGWTYGPVDRLVSVEGGLMRVFGLRGTEFISGASLTGGYTSTHPDGRKWVFDENGRQTAWISADGFSRITYTYDAAGKLSGITTPDGGTATVSYAGSVAQSILAPGGRTYALGHSGSDLTQITNPDGGTRLLGYSNGLLTNDQFAGLRTTYAYDVSRAVGSVTAGGVVNLVSPAIVQGLSAPVVGPVQSVTRDSAGNEWGTELDRKGRPVAQWEPGIGQPWRWDRNPAGWVVTETDPLLRTTTYTLDSANFVTGIAWPDAASRSYAYAGPNHGLTALTDERGQPTVYTYTPQGLVSTLRYANGYTTTFTWSSGLLVETRDAAVAGVERTTTYRYDAARRLTETIDPAGGVSKILYDSAGNQSVLIDQLLRRTTFSYDLMNRLTSRLEPGGGLTTWKYDGAGQLTETIDARQHVSKFEYDAAGRVTHEWEAVGTLDARDRMYEYDGRGLLTLSRNPLGGFTTYAYDPARRMTARTEDLGSGRDAETTWGYDAAGQVTQMVDPRGGTWKYEYDLRGRQTKVTAPLRAAATRLFDAAGNQVGAVDPSGVRTSYTYDPVGRQTQAVEGVGTPLARSSGVGYDLAGNVTVRTDPLGRQTAFAYDTLDRLTATTEAVGSPAQRLSAAAYDPVGNLTRATDPLGRATQYAYDALDRVTALAEASGTAQQRTTTFAYDAMGNLTRRTDPLGAQTDYANVRHTDYAYDALDRMTAMTEAVGRPEARAFEVTYNDTDQVTGVTDPLNQETRFDYDNQGRLTTEKHPTEAGRTYTRNPAGDVTMVEWNRMAPGEAEGLLGRLQFGYDAAGRLTSTREYVTASSSNEWTREYDATTGNLTATVEPLPGRRTNYFYDALNRHTATRDPLNGLATVEFDAGDNVTASVDRFGGRTEYRYDALDRLTRTRDAALGVWTMAYDNADNVTATIDARANQTLMVYDNLDRLSRTTDALLGAWSLAYDRSDNVTSRADALNRQTLYSYDALDRRTRTRDASNELWTMAYDKADNVTASTDALNRTTRMAHDAQGRVTQTTDPLGGVWKAAYDLMGNLDSTTDALQRQTAYDYDLMGRLTLVKDALNGLRTMAYDAVGNLTAESRLVAGVTRRVTYAYDALDRRTLTVDGANQPWATAYADAARQVTQVDPLGHRTTVTHDALWRATSRVSPLGNRTTAAYDAAGNLTLVTDPRGYPTQVAYDALDRPVAVTDALGHRATTVYDAVGNATVKIDRLGARVTVAYDALDRPEAFAGPLGQSAAASYDAAGQLRVVTDALGYQAMYSYDALGRLTQTLDQAGHAWSTGYDPVGNVTSSTDPLSHATAYAYDALNRLTLTTDALSRTTALGYDESGAVTRLTDPAGHRTTFSYDAAGRRTAETNALWLTATYAYDARGLLTSTTDRSGTRRDVSYDGDGRRVGEAWYEGGAATETLAFSYDPAGNVLSATKGPAGGGGYQPPGGGASYAYTYAYDALGRATQQQGPFGVTLDYGYDAEGKRTSLVDSAGGATAYQYDAAGRLASLRHSSAGQELRLDRAYTTRGELASETRYDDLAGVTLVGQSSYGYDAVGRATSIQHHDGSGALLVGLGYAYDPAGRLTGEAEGGVTKSYFYDATNQLTSAGAESFGYGPSGTRNTAGYAAGPNNRLAGADGWSYSYDGEGRRTGKTRPGESWSYSYDARGQMDTAERRDGSGAVLAAWSFGHDAWGNRVESSGPEGSYRAVFDGGEALVDLGAYFGQVQDRYVSAGDGGVPEARVSGGGYGFGAEQAWLLADRQGSLRVVTDGWGVETDRVTYAAFGAVASETDAAWGGRFKYAGGEDEPGLGLQRHGWRWLDAAIGQWTTEDPIGFAGGDSNLRRYVGNAPTNFTDPSGLAAEDDHRAAFLGRARESLSRYLEGRRRNVAQVALGMDQYGPMTADEAALRRRYERAGDRDNWRVTAEGQLEPTGALAGGLPPQLLELEGQLTEERKASKDVGRLREVGDLLRAMAGIRGHIRDGADAADLKGLVDLGRAAAGDRQSAASRAAFEGRLGADAELKGEYERAKREFVEQVRVEFESAVGRLKPGEREAARSAARWLYGDFNDFEPVGRVSGAGELVFGFEPTGALRRRQLEQAVASGSTVGISRGWRHAAFRAPTTAAESAAYYQRMGGTRPADLLRRASGEHALVPDHTPLTLAGGAGAAGLLALGRGASLAAAARAAHGDLAIGMSLNALADLASDKLGATAGTLTPWGVVAATLLTRKVASSPRLREAAKRFWKDDRGSLQLPHSGNGATGAASSSNPKVFRVQGGEVPTSTNPRPNASKHLLDVDASGNLVIKEGVGERIHINVGQEGRARAFLQRRANGGPAELIEFEIKPEFLDTLRREAKNWRLPRKETRGVPQKVDIGRNGGGVPDQYAIPPEWYEQLLQNAVPGSAKKIPGR